MPTYKNVSDGMLKVMSINGNEISVRPGNNVETMRYQDFSDWELVDHEPYYNPVAVRTSVEFADDTDDQTITLNAKTKSVLISDLSGCTVSIFWQSTDNTPPAAIISGGALAIDVRDNFFKKIVLSPSAAGSCVVTEYKEFIKVG